MGDETRGGGEGRSALGVVSDRGWVEHRGSDHLERARTMCEGAAGILSDVLIYYRSTPVPAARPIARLPFYRLSRGRLHAALAAGAPWRLGRRSAP